ncbi:uncharacterized protein STEHIDRAFT_136830 [Stereum hirsutum FP-91666 SS1]|uniref:uncharacterized protein n=1 Tax=Stereum hirsutum (strain FP-91666) TaxID=721885 RepID=UPI000440FC9D|nr:uncharacterized protein STEHIDRAFT_136830 [Stereum hirsutum FP-91666 SS1]EIM90888.1 hypothetical protein STEHIDRAFT_136830 [Stereum hirsutum FP-91666 SS1]
MAYRPPTPVRRHDLFTTIPGNKPSGLRKLQLQLHDGDHSARTSVRRKTRLTCEEDGKIHFESRTNMVAISLSKTTLVPGQYGRCKAPPSLTIAIPPPSLTLATVISLANPTPLAKGFSTPALTDDSASMSVSAALYSPSPTACSIRCPSSTTTATPMSSEVSLGAISDQPTVTWTSPLKRATTEKSFVKRPMPGGPVRTRSQRLRTLSANLSFGNLLERPSSQRPPSQSFTPGTRMRRVSSFISRSSAKAPTTPSPPFSPTDDAEATSDPFAMNGESYTVPSALSDLTSNVYDISAFTSRGCSPISEKKSPRSIKSSKSRTKRMKSKVNIYDLSVHDACTVPPREMGIARRERAKEMKARRKTRVISERRRSKRSSNPSGLVLGGKRSSVPPPSSLPAEIAKHQSVPSPDRKSCVIEPQSRCSIESNPRLEPGALSRQPVERETSKQNQQSAIYSTTDVRLLHDRHTSGVLATSLFTVSSQRHSQGRLGLLVPSDIPSILEAGNIPLVSSPTRTFRASMPSTKENVAEVVNEANHRFTTGARPQGLKPLSLPKPAFTTQSNVRSVLTASPHSNMRPFSYPPPRYQSELSSNAANSILYPDFDESIKLSAQGPAPRPTPRSKLRVNHRNTMASVSFSTLSSQTSHSEENDDEGKKAKVEELRREFTPLALPDFGRPLTSRMESRSGSDSDDSLESSEGKKGEEYGVETEETDMRRERVAVFEKGVWPKLIGGY